MAKTPPSPQQLGFSIEGGRLSIPTHLSEFPLGKIIIEALTRNSLFKERPEKGWVLVFDLTQNQPSKQIFDPSNWQQIDKNPENLINPNYSAVIITAPALFSQEELSQIINQTKPQLNQNGGEIFIFETNLSLTKEELESLRQQRKDIFTQAGLIKFKLSPLKRPKKQEPINEFLTQARFKKIAEHHPKPVDLLTPRPDDSLWKRKWRQGIIPQIIAMYHQAGFTEIDVSAIVQRLKKSTNPPVDLSKARDGFGVEAKAPCGCYIKVDLNGTITVFHHCQNHPDGIPNKKNFSVKKSPEVYNVGETETKMVCFDCGARIIQSVRRIESYPKGKTKIQIDFSCPHCGLLSTRIKYVPTKQIIE
jgi:predicted RNA-binding Zn-ribbon protein involved in translation (DUF1610 family)